MSLAIGDVIHDKYRIVSLLGQGGMGAVYEGENLLIARRVAIKVLHGGLASQQGVVERFEREAQAAGRIGNDHILEVLDMGKLSNGDRFMVMEFLDGETLEQRCERLGLLTPQQLYPLTRQLLSGLAAAHRSGIIHRDLKPENIFILREKANHPDFVKIIDFGISKFTALGNDLRMTATGAVMGTPYYMSPEQAKGSRESDARSDLYAVGVILFKAVTGRVPFDAATFNELLFKIVLSEAPRPGELVPGLDPSFEALILKAMARDPAQRFQSAQHFMDGLDSWAKSGQAVSVAPETAADRLSLAQQGTEFSPSGIGGASREHAAWSSAGAASVGAGATVAAGEALDSSETREAAAPGGITHGSWSNSGLTVPKKTSLPVLLGMAAAAALVIGGLLMVWSGSDDPEVAVVEANESGAASVAAEPSPPPAREAVVGPAGSEPHAAREQVDAGTNTAQPKLATSPQRPRVEVSPATVRAKPQPSPRPVVIPRAAAPKPTPKPPAPKPQAKPTPRAASKPAPTPKPAPARRSSEDDLFGY